MINSRRLHVCHLQERTEKSEPYYWSFIVQPDKSPVLFSIESTSPKIISKDGAHMEFKPDWSFVVNAPEVVDGVKTFRVCLTNDKAMKAKHDNAHGLVVKGKMSDYMHPIMVAADSMISDANDSVMVILEFRKDDKVLLLISLSQMFTGQKQAHLTIISISIQVLIIFMNLFVRKITDITSETKKTANILMKVAGVWSSVQSLEPFISM